jgi:hypothetical protein
MFSVVCEFTADAANGSVPDLDLTGVIQHAAFLADVGVVFGTPAPSGLTLTIKDKDGLTVHPNDTLSFSASKRYPLTERPSVIGGCKLSVSGNSTNSAKGKIILNFANNRR